MTFPSANTVSPIGSHRFGPDDQQRFATLTGDTNPMHLDAVAARRLLTGQLVVHGVHTLLAALNRLAPTLAPGADHLDCDFVNSVGVGDALDFGLDDSDDASLVLSASVRGLTCTRVALGRSRSAGASATPDLHATAAGAELWAAPSLAIDLAPQSWVGRTLRLALPAANFASDFPGASARFGERRVAAMGLLSTFVGMVCPGLNSVFSSLTLSLAPDDPQLYFRVEKFDRRFGLFWVSFDGCIRGQLRAFLRPPPQPQPSTRDLLDRVTADQFRGTQSWVIGGSRGLGELSAKLIAAGGGDVNITYAAGAADAVRVADDINRSGRGRAKATALDVCRDDFAAVLRAAPLPQAVFYFATPRIFRKKAGVFNPLLYAEFTDFYCTRFQALCLALEAVSEEQASPTLIKVFVPSTVFIDERPRGMTEYAMAKAAAELLCVDLQRGLRHVSFVVQRLPRLETDQTATILATKHASNIDTLLPIVQAMLAPTRAG